MTLRHLRLTVLAAATAAFAACASMPAMAQLPSLGAPTVQPGATEAATDAAVEAGKTATRRPAPRKATAKKPARKPKTDAARAEAIPRNGAIVVTNKRAANLLELSASPQNGGQGIVIARDVTAGARASGKLPAKSGCVFSLSGSFDDESTMEAANINLCKDGRINLVE